jgi:hypothetical protein
VAVAVDEVSFTRLGTILGLRIGLTLLIAFEDAFRADTLKTSARDTWTRKALGWGPRPAAAERRPTAGPRPATSERLTGNVWTDRARLGRD